MLTADNHHSPVVSSGSNAIDDVIIIKEGILAFVLDMNTEKEICPHCIPKFFLFRYAEWRTKYLLVIFKKSIDTGTIPKECKIATNLRPELISVHKSGPDTKVENWKPIPLLCTIYKFLEHFM